MRYRMLATYRGVPYEAGVGPSGADVVLFAACPPPEELGFEPAPGHWRKKVIRAEIDALWESRPVGTFGGEPCIVLDDLGDRLHIAYLGNNPRTATRLGYWQIDRGVFELLTPREDVTGLTEERVDRPLRIAPPLPAPAAGPGPDAGPRPVPDVPGFPAAPDLPSAPADHAEPPLPDPRAGRSTPESALPEQAPPEPSPPGEALPGPSLAEPTPAEPALPEPSRPEAAPPQQAPFEPASSERALAEPAPPERAQPEPSLPERAPTEPSLPESVPAMPSSHEPSRPEPSLPEPSLPEPSLPEPSSHEPARPEPRLPGRSSPDPALPEPAPRGAEPAPPGPAMPEPGPPESAAAADALLEPSLLSAAPARHTPPRHTSPQHTSPQHVSSQHVPSQRASASQEMPRLDVAQPAPARHEAVRPGRRPRTAENGGRASRRQRVATRDVFCDLADLAGIPRAAYALEAEVDGVLCLLPTANGYEVFVSADGARHEVRSFPDEEAAYFYLFGVLVAEAIRSGALTPAVTQDSSV